MEKKENKSAKEKKTSRPQAVLISDIHYSLGNLLLADASLRMAIDKARVLSVPLIIAGDLHDTKANIRGECVSALMATARYAEDTVIYVMVGNHDMINEKGKEHSLEFLTPLVDVVKSPTKIHGGPWLIPYQADPVNFSSILSKIPPGETIIMHQGVMGADMGHYVLDKSSLDPNSLSNYRVISGHYHKRQTVGTVDYIGSPYTISFGEAHDGAKGFQVLYTDGSLEFIPTGLRRHVIIETEIGENTSKYNVNTADLVWVKIKGPKLALDVLSKDQIALDLGLKNLNFKLDKIPTVSEDSAPEVERKSGEELIDLLIDQSNESGEHKKSLKALWREII